MCCDICGTEKRHIMKYVVVLGDGMADEPIEALGGKTPLETAQTPNLDRISKMADSSRIYN